VESSWLTVLILFSFVHCIVAGPWNTDASTGQIEEAVNSSWVRWFGQVMIVTMKHEGFQTSVKTQSFVMFLGPVMTLSAIYDEDQMFETED
jgi:hypothetical protein